MSNADLPVNPEEGGIDAAEGGVYVTRGVPDLIAEVIAPNVITANGAQTATPAGEYTGGMRVRLEGPTAHMFEARGIVKIIEVAPEISEPLPGTLYGAKLDEN